MNGLRIGTVSAFHEESGTVDVKFFDKGNPVGKNLTTTADEYRPLEPDEMVLCFFPEEGEGRGVCWRRLYSDKNMPERTGKNLVRVNFRDAFIEYDMDTGELLLSASTIRLGGEVVVDGHNITVTGGDVVADGVSLKGHGH